MRHIATTAQQQQVLVVFVAANATWLELGLVGLVEDHRRIKLSDLGTVADGIGGQNWT